LENEVFGEMAIPDCLGWEDCASMTVKVFNGLISLVPCRKWTGEKRYSVQAMKQYAASESWTKLFNIEHLEGERRLIASRKNDEVILLGFPKDEKNLGL
jgi:hypothetical protein